MGFKNNYNNHSVRSIILKSIETFHSLTNRTTIYIHSPSSHSATIHSTPFNPISIAVLDTYIIRWWRWHVRGLRLTGVIIRLCRFLTFRICGVQLNETFIIKNGFTIRHHHPPGDASQGHSHHYLLFADDGPWPGWNPIAPIGALPGGC